MSETAGNIQRMPDRSQRVREALLRFESASQRPGSVLELADDQLFEVGLLLSDPALSIADALRKTNETLGGAELSKSAFYRFADRFKSLLNQVTAEYAQRIARLTVDEATDSRIHDMTRISRFRLGELIAEKLVSTDNLDEVAKVLPKLATIVADAERGKRDDEKLELDRLHYERRLSETHARLEVAEQRVAQMQREAELKREKIEERLTKLRDTLESLASRVARGERITEDQLRHADADLEAVRGAAA